MKPVSYLIPHMKINSTWIKGLNVKQEAINKTPERKHEGKFCDILLCNDFSISHQRKVNTAKINKWDCIKIKCFYTVKKIINNIKGNLWNEGTYL